MKTEVIPELYRQYFIEKSDERRILFEKLFNLYHPEKGLYPGSFVHITPSFFISDMTYIDSDRRISKFFNDDNLIKYINANKNYDEEPVLNGLQADYSGELSMVENSFDILFSFYAGFISKYCKKYLKKDGVLVCNNSHGDASIAFLDNDFELIAVIKRNGDKFTLTEKDLDTYFVKKDGSQIDKVKVEKKMIGENFIKKGWAYIFRYRDNTKNII